MTTRREAWVEGEAAQQLIDARFVDLEGEALIYTGPMGTRFMLELRAFQLVAEETIDAQTI